MKKIGKILLLSTNKPKPYLAKYACNDRIHIFPLSSETCQYNSNVLTLVDVTCYVAGLIDISEVDWLGFQVYNQHDCLWHFEDKGPHAYRYSDAM